MRMWHKDWIHYLPKNQLIAQWRELCCIARNIAVNGTPNHILVNKVVAYPLLHFIMYANLVLDEMHVRDYNVNEKAYTKFVENCRNGEKHFPDPIIMLNGAMLYEGWMNEQYFIQCFYNLQEKYDCGGISDKEWGKIQDFYDIYKEGGKL